MVLNAKHYFRCNCNALFSTLQCQIERRALASLFEISLAVELFSRRQTTGSAQKSKMFGMMPCMYRIFHINTIAFCLGRYSIHLLLLKGSMVERTKGKWTTHSDRRGSKFQLSNDRSQLVEAGRGRAVRVDRLDLHFDFTFRLVVWNDEKRSHIVRDSISIILSKILYCAVFSTLIG